MHSTSDTERLLQCLRRVGTRFQRYFEHHDSDALDDGGLVKRRGAEAVCRLKKEHSYFLAKLGQVMLYVEIRDRDTLDSGLLRRELYELIGRFQEREAKAFQMLQRSLVLDSGRHGEMDRVWESN